MRWCEIAPATEMLDEAAFIAAMEAAMEEIAETSIKPRGTIKPKKPMDADAWRRESERRRKLTQRMADAKADCARKIQRIQRDV